MAHLTQVSLKPFILLFLCVTLGIACATKPKKDFALATEPLEFNTAIRWLANYLLRQLENNQILTVQQEASQLTKSYIVLKPFINEDTGEVVKISKDAVPKQSIEDIIMAETRQSQACGDETCQDITCSAEEVIPVTAINHIDCQKNEPQDRFTQFSIHRMTQANLPKAHYVMYGVIRLEPYDLHLPPHHRQSTQKHYRIYVSVVDQETQKIVANANVWIADDVLLLNNESMTVYRDSFLYLKDRGLEYLLNITIAPEKNTIVDRRERDFVDAILSDAAIAYENKAYKKANGLYYRAAKLAAGQIIETYAGLYQSYYKLNQLDEAEKAFSRMVELGAETRYLNTKFLFKVNSIDFGVVEEDSPAVKALISRYPLQLRQIAKHFSYSRECLVIVGHSSKTGSPEYNRQLALKRAQVIQELLHADFPSVLSKTIAQGKGFDECVVCTGSDDNLDAIDRRVEFKVVPCEELSSRYSMF